MIIFIIVFFIIIIIIIIILLLLLLEAVDQTFCSLKLRPELCLSKSKLLFIVLLLGFVFRDLRYIDMIKEKSKIC